MFFELENQRYQGRANMRIPPKGQTNLLDII
jgi:hypothetical protein